MAQKGFLQECRILNYLNNLCRFVNFAEHYDTTTIALNLLKSKPYYIITNHLCKNMCIINSRNAL